MEESSEASAPLLRTAGPRTHLPGRASYSYPNLFHTARGIRTAGIPFLRLPDRRISRLSGPMHNSLVLSHRLLPIRTGAGGLTGLSDVTCRTPSAHPLASSRSIRVLPLRRKRFSPSVAFCIVRRLLRDVYPCLLILHVSLSVHLSVFSSPYQSFRSLFALVSS